MKLLLVMGALASLAIALPVDPDSEVEFVRPTNTNDGPPQGAGGGPRFPFPGGFGGGDEEGGDGFVPVIIVRRVGGGDGDGGFGLPGGFPFVGSGGDGGLDLRGLLDTFFGGGGGPGAGFIPTIDGGEDGEVVLDGEVGDSPPPCGLICTMLREFQSRIDQVEREIKDIEQKKEDEENEIDGTGSGSNEEEDDDDKYEQTYEEKVLPNGAVVRINRTSFSDASEDGSSFFFHSTAIHNIGDGDDVGDDETVEKVDDEVESLPDVSEDVDSGVDVGLTGEN